MNVNGVEHVDGYCCLTWWMLIVFNMLDFNGVQHVGC